MLGKLFFFFVKDSAVNKLERFSLTSFLKDKSNICPVEASYSGLLESYCLGA
jgi:hypothetical protein